MSDCLAFINTVPVAFSKVCDAASRLRPVVEEFLAAGGDGATVIAIDLALTDPLRDLLLEARGLGAEVHYMDHHLADPLVTDADKHYALNVVRLRRARVKCKVDTRREKPACLCFVDKPYALLARQQGRRVLVLADQDPDGLWAAMGLCGLTYKGMLHDAKWLDGGRGKEPEGVTELARLYVRSLASLPNYEPDNPTPFRGMWHHLAHLLTAYVGGEMDTWPLLEQYAEEYKHTVARAMDVPLRFQCNGRIVLAHLRPDKKRVDLPTLEDRMRNCRAATVLVVVKTIGTLVSAGFPRQYQVDVVGDKRRDIDLKQAIVGLKTGHAQGLVCNEGWRMNCAPMVWEKHVLPWLKKRLKAMPWPYQPQLPKPIKDLKSIPRRPARTKQSG
jgi:hypothetical protein